MNLKNFFVLVPLLTLYPIVTIQFPGMTETTFNCNPEPGCSESVALVTIQNSSQIVKGSGPEVFLIQDGKRRWITDSTSFISYGFKYSNVKEIFDDEVEKFPVGEPISNNGTLLKGSRPEIYIIIDGKRRLVSPIDFNKQSQSHFPKVYRVRDSILLSIPE